MNSLCWVASSLFSDAYPAPNDGTLFRYQQTASGAAAATDMFGTALTITQTGAEPNPVGVVKSVVDTAAPPGPSGGPVLAVSGNSSASPLLANLSFTPTFLSALPPPTPPNTNAEYYLPDAFTITAWYYVPEIGTDFGTRSNGEIIAFTQSGANVPVVAIRMAQWSVRFAYTPIFRFIVSRAGEQDYVDLATVDAAGWYFSALTYNMADGRINGYARKFGANTTMQATGKNVTEFTAVADGTYPLSNVLKGFLFGGTPEQRFLNGRAHKIQMFNRALTATEINAVYAADATAAGT